MADARRRARLTSDEVAVVLRRAAEIEASLEDHAGAGGYDPAAVEAAADEVGLSPAAVRQALAELRAGSLQDGIRAPARRGARSQVVAEQRLVDSDPGAALAAADRLLRAQLLDRRRRTPDQALYRPRTDPMAAVQRKLNLRGTIRLGRVSCVTVVASRAGDETLVRMEAELATNRVRLLSTAASAGVGVGLASGLAGALLAEPVLVIGALPAGAVVGAGGARVASRRWQEHRDEVAEGLAAIIDRL